MFTMQGLLLFKDSLVERASGLGVQDSFEFMNLEQMKGLKTIRIGLSRK